MKKEKEKKKNVIVSYRELNNHRLFMEIKLYKSVWRGICVDKWIRSHEGTAIYIEHDSVVHRRTCVNNVCEHVDI